MDIFVQYSVAVLALFFMEILLSGDNAVVLGIMAKHLPKEQQAKALRYGLAGAFVFRFACFFLIAIFVDVWQIMAIGAAYLLFISAKHLIGAALSKGDDEEEEEEKEGKKKSGFWMTVLKIELMDIVFAVDSMIAAVAFAVALPPLNVGKIGNMDIGQFAVIMIGGMAGIIAIRYLATLMIKLLNERPGLEHAAYGLIMLIGVKLVVITLAHPKLQIIDEHFPHSILFQSIFWTLMVGISALGWFLGGKKVEEASEGASSTK